MVLLITGSILASMDGRSILTSGGILTSAGLVLGLISTNGVISQLGILIARGAVLSAILVLVFLPSMLANMEPVIKRTTDFTW